MHHISEVVGDLTNVQILLKIIVPRLDPHVWSIVLEQKWVKLIGLPLVVLLLSIKLKYFGKI